MPRTRKQPPAPDQIRARLRQLIDADGRTKAAIAEAAGMSKSQFGQVLSGHRANSPRYDTLARVLAALGRSFADLERP